MTISEAVRMLQAFEKSGHGGCDIIGMTEVDGRFAIDEDRVFDLVWLPDESSHQETLVCAFMEPIDITPPTNEKGLKLVA